MGASNNPPATQPRRLKAMLMGSHSRGVMLHFLGAATLYPEAKPAPQVSTRPYLFGAPQGVRL